MHFGISSWVDVITERIIARLVSQNVLPEDYIVDYIGEAEDLMQNPPSGERFIAVAPTRLQVDQPSVTGGGAALTVFPSEWRVDVFTRLMEREFRSAKLLSGQSRSLAQFVKSTIAALHVQPITLATADDYGDMQSPLIQPLRLTSVNFTQRRPKTGWAYARTLWQAHFQTDFTG